MVFLHLLEQDRFTIIAHGNLQFWNPVSPDLMDRWIQDLPLSSSSRILDVGCGRGEFLLRTVERFECAAVGIDRLSPIVLETQKEAARRLPLGNLEILCESFDPQTYDPASFDLTACVGSTHAISNLPDTLRVLSGLVRSGGTVLVGDGFWKRRPEPEYLDFLGTTEDELLTHQGNLSLARDLGLEVIREHQATKSEWSHYEDTYAANVREFVAKNPEDPDAAAMDQKIEAWRNAYLKWGRDTLGFGLYLLRKTI